MKNLQEGEVNNNYLEIVLIFQMSLACFLFCLPSSPGSQLNLGALLIANSFSPIWFPSVLG